MKVREHVAELLKLPQDHEVMDEYGEERITGYRVSTIDTSDGVVDYVMYETEDAE